MVKAQFTSKKGVVYSVQAPSTIENLSRCYVFAFAKSGSTLLENMLSTYCQIKNIPRFSIFDAAFSQGVGTADIDGDTRTLIERNGRIYSGFRHYPSFDLNVAEQKTLLLVRDPRDMLVSMYYSILKSHKIPKGNDSLAKQRVMTEQRNIDEDVLLRARSYLNQFNRYQKMLVDSQLITYRYEDVIYKKEEWFTHILNHFGLPIDQACIKTITKKFDIIPNDEKQSEHIRQVHPGNYLKKLKPEDRKSVV